MAPCVALSDVPATPEPVIVSGLAQVPGSTVRVLPTVGVPLTNGSRAVRPLPATGRTIVRSRRRVSVVTVNGVAVASVVAPSQQRSWYRVAGAQLSYHVSETQNLYVVPTSVPTATVPSAEVSLGPYCWPNQSPSAGRYSSRSQLMFCRGLPAESVTLTTTPVHGSRTKFTPVTVTPAGTDQST